MTLTQSIERFNQLLSEFSGILADIPAAIFVQKPGPDKWSKQEILGHLIDSAVNNHQRFIRIQYEIEPVVYYDQNKWNELSAYNTADKNQLIQLWLLYNRHLIQIIGTTPVENLAKKGSGRDGQLHTLEWYITDYVAHMEHHLRQIVGL